MQSVNPRSRAAVLLAVALAAACIPEAAGASKFRMVYSAGNGTALPGVLQRSEFGAPASDPVVNAAFDTSGDVYDAFFTFFGRDSYDDQGATIISTVHYGNAYCNGTWNGTQFYYGDGNPAASCLPMTLGTDVAAHEYMHAITEHESALVFSGESGGMSEALSDIFAAFVEAWVDGGRTGTLAVSADTWKIGEDVLPPALRYMNDPALDGFSRDYWTSTAGSVDVRYSSGIANLAFYLLSQGGTHPRGKSSIVVTGIGMEKALRVFWGANTDHLNANSTFAQAKSACVAAAAALGLSAAEQASVADAWSAVGVSPPTPPPPPSPVPIMLVNGVPVTGLSGVLGSERFFFIDVAAGVSQLSFTLRGGTGDADLYVRAGVAPTSTSYSCRPYTNGNNETCTFANPAAGRHYVMLRGYTAYAMTTLTASHSAGPVGDPFLTNGVPVTGISGSVGSVKYWRIRPAPNRTLTITLRGTSGDADLYVRRGSRPTISAYDCRPYSSTSNETCTIANTADADYFIMIRGFSSYSGITLTGTY